MDENGIIRCLRTCPHTLEWSAPRTLNLRRNKAKRLGVIINTYAVQEVQETYTVITKVKEECVLQDRSKLSVGCRIIKIVNKDIICWSFDQVVQLLQKLQKSGQKNVKLKLCQPEWNTLSVKSDPQSVRDSRRPLQTLSLPGAQRDAHVTHRCGQHSGTPTPVGQIEDMTLARGSHGKRSADEPSPISEFSSLEEGVSDHEEVLISEALCNPWKIIWSDKTKMVEIKKQGKYQQRIGLKYKFKKKDEKSEDGYCIVEMVEAEGPAHGILFPGDLIHSVNSRPITDENTLKTVIVKSTEDRIKMCIQSPKDLLNKGEEESMEFKSLSNSIRTDEIHIHTSVDSNPTRKNTRLIPNGAVKPVAEAAQVKPKSEPKSKQVPAHLGRGESVSAKRKASTADDRVRSRISGSIHVTSFQKGHRRTHSDSSSAYFQHIPDVYHRGAHHHTQHHTHTGARPKVRKSATPTADDTPDQFATSSNASCGIESCLSKWASSLYRKECEHFPYVRLIQISTESSHNVPIHKQLVQILNLESNLERSSESPAYGFQGKYTMSESGLMPVGSQYKAYTVEELILAKHCATYLKEQKFVLDNLTRCAKLLGRTNERVQRLTGRFLEEPPDVDASFVGVESFVLNFEEVCLAEYSVLFSKNSVFVISVNVSKFRSEPEAKDELERIRTCLNHVRMVCDKPSVYFVTENNDADTEVEEVAANQLSELRPGLKQICSCARGLVDISDNSMTSLPLFNLHSHAEYLKKQLFRSMKGIVRPGFGQKFPLLALKIQRAMAEKRDILPFVTQTELSGMLRQICPDLDDAERVTSHMLTSLHCAGKWINPSQIHHTTMNDKSLGFLRMFALYRPQFLIYCAREMNSQSEHGTVHDDSPYSLGSAKIVGDRVVLAYLQLFHVVEEFRKSEYRFAANASHLRRQNGVVAALEGAEAETYWLDFDGFLPCFMTNYLFCEIAKRHHAKPAFVDDRTAVMYFPTVESTAEIHLDPIKCIGSIRIFGRNGSAVYGFFESCVPVWLPVKADKTYGRFAGFSNSFDSLLEYGLETRVSDLPADLMRVISWLLHPSASPLGNDIRLLADKLLSRSLLPHECVNPTAGMAVVEEWVNRFPQATLGHLLYVIRTELERLDICQDIRDWMQQNSVNINIL